MEITKGCAVGWFLVMFAVSLLLVQGQYGLIFVLLPVSLLVACGIMWPGAHRSDSVQRSESK